MERDFLWYHKNMFDGRTQHIQCSVHIADKLFPGICMHIKYAATPFFIFLKLAEANKTAAVYAH